MFLESLNPLLQFLMRRLSVSRKRNLALLCNWLKSELTSSLLTFSLSLFKIFSYRFILFMGVIVETLPMLQFKLIIRPALLQIQSVSFKLMISWNN